MRSNFMRILCLCSVFLLGCGVQPEDSQEDEVSPMEEEEETALPPVKDNPKNSSQIEQEKKTDEGFNPCPSDIYMILEKDGVQYSVVIQVFCDPIQNTLNLGCPEPY
jgi:hypothetical protein